MDKWEVARKGVYYYVIIDDSGVTIGQEGAPDRDQTWNENFSFEMFLEGTHHDMIVLEFGKDILSDMLLTAKSKKGKYIGMSLLEARLFLFKLKEGKKFSTRIKGKEWGLVYLGNEEYRKWGRNIVKFSEHCHDEEEILSEGEILDLLMKHYNYDILKNLLHH